MSNPKLGSYILVITRKNDATTDYVLQRMINRGIPFFRLDTENFGQATIALRFPNIFDSSIFFGDAEITINQIGGVWLRRLAKPTANNVSQLEARSFAESELDFTLRWFIGLLNDRCPVLDDEGSILKGQNKFDQLAFAKEVGLSIPSTLITNEPIAAKAFVKKYKRVAVKSVAGYGRQIENGFYTVYTNIVTDDIIDRFESIRFAPVCLQEYIEKEFELRVTVVGSQVFPCRIDSQSTQRTNVDWRHYDTATPHSIYKSDPTLNNCLITIMKRYGVRFASFDLIVTPGGEIIFLEMNPASQFLWIEKLTGMQIADALIDEILMQH